MKYILPTLLGAALICTVGFAGEHPRVNEGGTVALQAGDIAGAPAALRLRIVQNGFQLTWQLSPQDPGPVTGYEIVRADRFSGPYEPVATVEKGTARYIDTSAAREIIYFYKIRAVAGKGHSPFSNTVTGER